MDIIRIANIVLYAHHGVAPQEQELGQRFYVDVELRRDLSEAAREDDLAATIDYDAVYQAVSRAFTEARCRLIEHAAWRVIKALFRQFPVEEVTIQVRKPSAPVEGIFDAVSVEISRKRHEVDLG